MSEISKLTINNIDIHNHTFGSDGKQSSLRNIVRAYKNGINIISITDHDSVSEYKKLDERIYSACQIIKNDKSYHTKELLDALKKVKVIKGVELITSFNGVIVEVLGYNFDIDSMEKEIVDLKKTIKEKNYEVLYRELKKIVKNNDIIFDKKVLDNSYEMIKEKGKGSIVGPFYNELISHQENKKYLIIIDDGEEKVCSLKQFINKHLYNKNSIFFVDMETTRPTFKDTISAIHKSNGKAFLAHAGRYKDKLNIEESLDDMINYGLDGLEVFYPDHSYDFIKLLLEKVKKYNLLVSGGSDDHYSKKEGYQYTIGSIAIPNIKEILWIKEIIDKKEDYFSTSDVIQNSIIDLEKTMIKKL